MTAPAAEGTWVVVVPVKPLGLAKSRLSAPDDSRRRELSLAFASDTVSAALEALGVRTVVVVGDDPRVTDAVAALGAAVLSGEPAGGLNAALAYAEQHVRAQHPGAGVAALVGDLPALRPTELARAFELAGSTARWFVGDAAGIGTTLLCAAPGASLDPRFGGRSRAAHARSGALELRSPGLSGLRRDVDDEVGLWDAVRLGVGPATRALGTGR